MTEQWHCWSSMRYKYFVPEKEGERFCAIHSGAA